MKDWISTRRKMRRKIFLETSNFTITKREVLASLTIVAVMVLIGFFISGRIQDHYADMNAEYNKAIHITDPELFQYGIDTNVGNAFVYGNLEAIDTVTYPEIGGEYLYVEKVEEHYNMHTRVVKCGKTTTVQTYWSWDYAGSEDIHSQKIQFCGLEMDYCKVKMPDTDYIETINTSSHVRFKYYGCKTKYTGTIYTRLGDGTISDNSCFYAEYGIDETAEALESSFGFYIFWILWLILTSIVVYGFYYLDNDWLED